MRFCHQCGARIAPEDVFCSYCGVSLQSELAASKRVRQSFEETGSTENALPDNGFIANTNETIDEHQSHNASPSLIEEKIDELSSNEPQTILSQLLQPVISENKLQTLGHDLANNVVSIAVSSQTFDQQSEDARADNAHEATIANENAEFNQPNSLVDAIDKQTADKSPFAVSGPDNVAQSEDQEDSNSKTIDDNLAGEVVESEIGLQTVVKESSETARTKSPKLKPLDNGAVLNSRYEIVRRIGGGGMGAVYLAKDLNLGGVQRAVKEMIQAYVDESQQEKAVQDFRRESLLLSQLEHPSIPTIYDYFYEEAGGRFYLVMKYISGGDLSARLRSTPEGKIDETSVTKWAIQIADVLDYLHHQQPPIVYRDLKPSNIMLDTISGKAMLIDFGIARWVNKEEKGVTAVGTMGYAPPELFAGNAEPRSDIYSLGATMFHLLTGADPQSNPLLIFDFNKNPKPRQINLALSVEIEDILLRAVEYNPGLRFESAAKMRDALEQHLEKLNARKVTFERDESASLNTQYWPPIRRPATPSPLQPSVSMVFCGFSTLR